LILQPVEQLCLVDQEFHQRNLAALRFDGDAGKTTLGSALMESRLVE